MPLWFAAFLGVVQGLTEFLPISSTAHLRIAPTLLGRADPGAAYTAVIQLGTLLAVVAYFVRELVRMLRGVLLDRGSPEARLALLLVVGTIPIGIAGLLFERYIVGAARSLWVVAGALAVVAVIMAVADRKARHTRGLEALGVRDAILVGVAQACALIPGVSRSGATITAGLLIGLRRDDAARFSFLLSVPAIAAAGVFELPEAISALGPGATAPLVVGTLVSALAGYASIAWLLRFLRTRTLVGFAAYRITLALALVGLLAAGVIPAL